MRKVILIFGIGCFLVSFNLTKAQAGWWKKDTAKEIKEEQETASKTAPVVDTPKVNKVDKEKELELANKKAILDSKMIALNNTKWQIELVSMSAKEKKQTISLSFKDKQVSTTFTDGDFPVSNFTAFINDDGSLVWETMQTGEKEGVLFWRGELSTDTASMRGILSHMLPDKTTQDYSFSSSKKEPLSASQ